MSIKEIVNERSNYLRGCQMWNKLNAVKNSMLLNQKKSMSDNILYFMTSDLGFINEGYIEATESIMNKLYSLPQTFERRCELEHNADYTKHPIPYVIIKSGDRYFFILREKGSGEQRLHGKKGLIGGHVDDVDKQNTLEETIRVGFLREVEEETGLTHEDIDSVELVGLIKSYANDTDIDHLGLVYVVEIPQPELETQEEGVISGLWLHKDEILKHYDEFESWSQLCIDNYILK